MSRARRHRAARRERRPRRGRSARSSPRIRHPAGENARPSPTRMRNACATCRALLRQRVVGAGDRCAVRSVDEDARRQHGERVCPIHGADANWRDGAARARYDARFNTMLQGEHPMPTVSSPIALGWPAARFDLPGHRRPPAHARQRARPERARRHVHLQPLPVREGGRRQDRPRHRRARGLGIGSIAIMSNDADRLSGGLVRQHEDVRRAARLPLPVRRRRIAGRRARLRRRVHARLLRLRSRSRRSRITAGSTRPAAAATRRAKRELYEAMAAVARTGRAPVEQTPSIGCSIKWRAPPRS